ncbi:MAG: Hpt domain-containing protein [Desulfobacteraceae bacterium]|nr:Hpt domain-containing protein [Desulfobacteraceae bacterium]
MTKEDEAGHGEKIIVQVDEEIADLVPGFLENRRKDVIALKEAFARGEYETIGRLGHKLKGTGGGYGFDLITDLGQSLEEAAEEENNDEIQKRVQELFHFLENVEVIYG